VFRGGQIEDGMKTDRQAVRRDENRKLKEVGRERIVVQSSAREGIEC